MSSPRNSRELTAAERIQALHQLQTEVAVGVPQAQAFKDVAATFQVSRQCLYRLCKKAKKTMVKHQVLKVARSEGKKSLWMKQGT